MSIPNSVNEIEKVVGTREGFFEDLLNKDDWSFVIKLHAFFESICTQLLLFHFNQPDLKSIFGRLELSDKTTGKIAFLEKLGLISKENRRYIASLSELRNKLVHDVFNCEFKFSEYVEILNSDKIKSLAISFSPFETFVGETSKLGPQGDGNKKELKKQAEVGSIINRFKNNPKEHIHIGARNVLVNIIDSHYYSDYQQWVIANSFLGTNAVQELQIEVLRDLKDRMANTKKTTR